MMNDNSYKLVDDEPVDENFVVTKGFGKFLEIENDPNLIFQGK